MRIPAQAAAALALPSLRAPIQRLAGIQKTAGDLLQVRAAAPAGHHTSFAHNTAIKSSSSGPTRAGTTDRRSLKAAASSDPAASVTMAAFDAEQEAACAAVRLAARLCQVSMRRAPSNRHGTRLHRAFHAL